MARFDPFDQAVLTDVVNKPLQTMREDQAFLGERIAPTQNLQSRTAKLEVYDVVAFGLGQFKAPDATPALFKPSTTMRETVIELALLEEMERISGEDWLKLNSSDPTIQRTAGMSLVQRGRVLQLRNERLSEWMRWQMLLTGTLTITYPTGQQLFIDYGLASTHKPTPTTLWSDVANADPVADIQAWSELLAADSGHFGVKAHMTSKTYDYLIRNTKIKNMINFYAGGHNLLRPRKSDILELFTSFAASVDIVIYDNGYRAEGTQGQGWPGSLTKYLPDGKVLMTTEYTVEGEKIADTLDGQVLVNASYNSVAIRQGAQSEVILDPMSKNHFFRQASARIPRLRLPECILVATVA